MIYCATCEELLEGCSCPPNPYAERQVGDTPRVTALRLIVSQHQAMKVDGFLIDGTSAHLYLQVWEAIDRGNKAKLDAQSLSSAMRICWQLASRDK